MNNNNNNNDRNNNVLIISSLIIIAITMIIKMITKIPRTIIVSGPEDSSVMRPISVPTFWISEGLTQAYSKY